MTMTETLFGGLLAVALIFFIARVLSLPVFWSGILSAALPFVAYLAYSAGAWPGGDVLAIHLVVFTATAAVLGIFNNLRQAKSKMHWAPKLIIGFFILLVIINALLMSIATHGLPDSVAAWLFPSSSGGKVHTGFPGVVPHDRNKLYESHQQRMEAQRELGWQIELRGLDQLQADNHASLVASLQDAQGRPLAAEQVTLEFWRVANRRDDIALALQPSAAGEYRVQIALPAPGRWVAVLSVAAGGNIHQTQYPLQIVR